MVVAAFLPKGGPREPKQRTIGRARLKPLTKPPRSLTCSHTLSIRRRPVGEFPSSHRTGRPAARMEGRGGMRVRARVDGSEWIIGGSLTHLGATRASIRFSVSLGLSVLLGHVTFVWAREEVVEKTPSLTFDCPQQGIHLSKSDPAIPSLQKKAVSALHQSIDPSVHSYSFLRVNASQKKKPLISEQTRAQKKSI